MITLTAREDCNPRFTPGAKKPYIARITGRDRTKTFAREFLGKTSVDVDTPGLYEGRGVNKKGFADDPEYVLILEGPGGEVEKFTANKEDAMKIAKALDDGRRFEDVVAYGETGWSFRTPKEAAKEAIALTIDKVTEACWQLLQHLPEKEAKKVLAALRQRVSPPKPEAPALPTQASDTEGVS
jgi:hypothetical protein